MKRSIALAAVLGLVFFSSSAGATEGGAPRPHHRRHFHHEMRPVPRSDARRPVDGQRAREVTQPSTPRHLDEGGGGEDGMSTNPDNCNTGCVGGNPD